MLDTNAVRRACEFQLTQAECFAALRFNQSRLTRSLPRSYLGLALRAVNAAAWFVVWLLMVSLSRSSAVADGSFPRWLPVWLSLSLLAALVSLIVSQHEVRRRAFHAIAARSASLRDKRTVTIEDGGLRSDNTDGEAWVRWHAIRSVEECDGLILVYLDGVSSIPIPSSAFPDPAARAEFLADLRERVRAAEQAPMPSLDPLKKKTAPTSAAFLPPQWRMPNLSAHLTQGFRLAAFQRPTLDLTTAQSWSTLVALVFLSVALSFLGERLVAGPKSHFTPFGFPGLLFPVPVAMVTASALARLQGRAEQTLGLWTVIMSLAIPIELAEVLSRLKWTTADHYLTMTQTIFAAWFTLASAIAAIRLLGTPSQRWLGSILLTGLLMGLPLTSFHRNRTLWWRLPDEETLRQSDRAVEEIVSRYRALAREEIFYLQPKLLEEQLAQIKPSRPGVVDLYFLGLGAYALQDVFMKEVQSMAKLFDERFDTAGRSLMLINNAATVRMTPIASATSLGVALRRFAQVMDRDEDILFLFITSHGSKKEGVAFDFSPLEFEQLGPNRLKELLDQYGIKRRVVVVSACYSGQYVDALEGDDTVVISASASDKNSFGCSNEAEFTYFGKAYFDALQQTYSFVDAFELAKPIIATRESKAHYGHSEPRIFVGEKIKRALDDFVRIRESAAKAKSVAVIK